jgi:hypothetical protein
MYRDQRLSSAEEFEPLTGQLVRFARKFVEPRLMGCHGRLA